MNIGIDIDDTIVNTYDMLLTLISMRYNLCLKELMKKRMPYTELFKSLKDFDVIKRDIFPIMAKSVFIKDDVINILNKLKKDGHKIIFISARNFDDYEDPYGISYDFLIKNKIPFDKLIVNASDKGTVCLNEKIDVFIDDSMRNCEDVKKVGINTLQFDAIFTKNVDNVKRVFNWNEVYTLICE